MWHWSQNEIAFMKQKLQEGYRGASRGASDRILTLHRNPIEIFIMGEWCSAGSEEDYQEIGGVYLPHLLCGQYVDMMSAAREDCCSVCKKGKLVFSPVLLHQSFAKDNKSIFKRHWECPACGASGDILYRGRLERISD